MNKLPPPYVPISSTELTERQLQTYRWIAAYFVRHQQSPTIREIGQGLGISSPNGVMCHLIALQRKRVLAGVKPGLTGTSTARSLRFPGVTFVPTFSASPAGDLARDLWQSVLAPPRCTEQPFPCSGS